MSATKTTWMVKRHEIERHRRDRSAIEGAYGTKVRVVVFRIENEDGERHPAARRDYTLRREAQERADKLNGDTQ